MKEKIAIVGGGNGGQAFAAYLSLHGHEVNIYDVSQETVDILNQKGGIEIQGNCDVTGFGKIALASTNIEEVIRDTRVILMVLPSLYHKDMAEKMAPYLVDGQIVVLNPNASLGTFEVRKALDDCKCKADIILACTATLLFACRATEVGHVQVAGQKTTFTASTHPSSKNEYVGEIFKDILPQFIFAQDVIRVSLDNLNAVVHPAPSILNTGRIESGIPYEYYIDMTPGQVKMIEGIDKERMALSDAFDAGCRTTKEEYIHMYNAKGETLHEVITTCDGYHGIMGQSKLKTRYIMEDIPCSLVAFQTLGKIANVPTPCIDAMIVIAHTIVDGIEEGRTLKNLGLEDVSKEEFMKLCRG